MENKQFKINPQPDKKTPYRADKFVLNIDDRFPFLHISRLCANSTENNGKVCLNPNGCQRYCQRDINAD